LGFASDCTQIVAIGAFGLKVALQAGLKPFEACWRTGAVDKAVMLTTQVLDMRHLVHSLGSLPAVM